MRPQSLRCYLDVSKALPSVAMVERIVLSRGVDWVVAVEMGLDLVPDANVSTVNAHDFM